ncbi:MAG: efflux RND transporter periplasmic adaptor subunit [Alphaproteobacteria bacterium]|nr:efflux RND transporter periplasmic adaptor subunit [Alphaproteobacteria bacterium]MDX5368097.1 efflux RND transporter periplasmic adaptor subunit [Alphaproteobacteria bacterium]MDX5462936.1 efflux RND transporter periplasmic adaptor subunit [Alphaproteobacteria bacterium]
MRLLKPVLLILALLAAAGAAWLYTQRPVAVATQPVTRGDAAEIVYATGVVEPVTWSKVTPLVRERIVSVCDCEGREVEAGDELARLDDSEAQATLEELTARSLLARQEVERYRNLAARNVTSRQDLERAESELTQVEAAIAGQRARLDNFVLRAPLDGVVLRQDGEVGEIAEPGDVLFWVGQLRPLQVVADVNEEDIPRIRPGQRTLLSSDAFPGRALDATVESITPKGDPVTKTYRVRFALPAETPLMIGMTVDVNVVVGTSEDTLLVPAAAVDGDTVFVVEDGRALRRSFTPGIRGTRQVEALDGLAPGARVIVPYPDALAGGARVRERE